MLTVIVGEVDVIEKALVADPHHRGRWALLILFSCPQRTPFSWMMGDLPAPRTSVIASARPVE